MIEKHDWYVNGIFAVIIGMIFGWIIDSVTIAVIIYLSAWTLLNQKDMMESQIISKNKPESTHKRKRR